MPIVGLCVGEIYGSIVCGRRLDRAAQHNLDVDSRNKQHAQLIDERMHRLNNLSIELAYHDDIEHNDDTCVETTTLTHSLGLGAGMTS